MKIAILDCNYLCHKARFTTGQLKYNDLNTGVIYGFLEQMLTIASVLNTYNFVFVWDSKYNLRKEYYPNYKAKRRKEMTPEEALELKIALQQFSILRKRILPDIGFNNNFMQEGYEGDDLIAQITKQYKDEELVIVSSDEDLLQLLTPNIKIFNFKEIKTIDKFCNEYGINPQDWIRVKAIGGCSSDNVIGIKGIGEKTVCKYLTNNLNKETNTYKKFITDEAKQIEEFNIKLVKLPYEGTQEIILKNDNFNIFKFKEICVYYGFKSFLEERIDEWEKFNYRDKYK